MVKTHINKTKTQQNRDIKVKIYLQPGLEAQKVEKRCDLLYYTTLIWRFSTFSGTSPGEIFFVNCPGH